MKLSEAIREGIGDTEQAIGSLCVIANGKVKLCALGAALHAVRPLFWKHPGQDRQRLLYESFPELEADGGELWEQVSTLNDQEQWGRLAIAEWLEEQGL